MLEAVQKELGLVVAVRVGLVLETLVGRTGHHLAMERMGSC